MVVESLGHQLQGQWVLVAAGLFDLGPLVLEPDFDLWLVQVEFLGQGLSPLLRDVAVRLELVFQSLQLFGRERCPRPLVLLGALLLFQFPCPGAWRGNNNWNKMFISLFQRRPAFASNPPLPSTAVRKMMTPAALYYLLKSCYCLIDITLLSTLNCCVYLIPTTTRMRCFNVWYLNMSNIPNRPRVLFKQMLRH